MFKEGELAKALNTLAREQMKARLLGDIAVDLQVCKLEGLDAKEYCQELKAEIDKIYNLFTTKEDNESEQ